MNKELSLHDQWLNGTIGNFGGFQTKLFTAYSEADSGNQRRLQTAFPQWFGVPQTVGLLTLHRKGRIETDKTSPNQCKDIGWRKYAYQVAITCPCDNTDTNEFIIDNSVVHRAIVDCFFEHMTSCEGMVKRVAGCLFKTAIEHGVNVLNLEVMIRPLGVDEESYAWFTWKLKP